MEGIHWITVANGKHSIYLIDNNSFVVTILDQFKRLAEKQNVEIVNEDVADDNFADKISQKFDLIMVTIMLHEAGRTVTGDIETVTNKEKEIPLRGKDAQVARSKLYQNLSLSLTKTGVAMIFEVSPNDQWNSKTITNEIEKEGKLQVTGSNDRSINGRIVSQVNVEVKISSSLVVGRDLQQFGSDADKKGGIAFNTLPIQTESVASSALGVLPGARAFKGDLDAEWARIQDVFTAGIRPSIQRISEYTAAAAASSLAENRIDQVRVMLADILRRDEESQKLIPAEESCKQLLMALEAG